MNNPYNPRFIFLLFLILIRIDMVVGQEKHVVFGKVSNKSSNEILIGATIYCDAFHHGAVTNDFGFFTFECPGNDSLTLEVSYVGFQKHHIRIKLSQDSCINIFLTPAILKEVQISSEKSGSTLLRSKPGQITIDNSAIVNTAALFGEHDVLSYLQLMPGVSNGSEASTYFSVRGGGMDQNLILLDDAPVYSSNHLFGYFSNLNEDIIKKAELWKGYLPPKFGGKVSSVVDVRTKDGDQNKMHGSFSIGVISTKLSLEGPIKKQRSSFVFAFRRSNLDFTLPLFLPNLTDYSRYHFMDVNLKLNHTINNNNRLYLSGYYGRDKFTEPGETSSNYLEWYNALSTLRWNHVYSSRWFSNTSFIFSKYLLENLMEEYTGDTTYFQFQTKVRTVTVKHDVEYLFSSKTRFSLGVHLENQQLRPGFVASKGIQINSQEDTTAAYNVFSGAVYGEIKGDVTENLHYNLGAHLGYFASEGTKTFSPQPRLSVSYDLNARSKINLAYSVSAQPIHMLSSTGIGTPTDLWVPMTEALPLETGQQVTAGIAKDLKNLPFSFSIEAYFKTMNNIIALKPGASFLSLSADPSKIVLPDWSKYLINGEAESYGFEFFAKKEGKVLSGFTSYTLAWAKQHFDEINYGKVFYAPYDVRHKVSIQLNYSPVRKEIRKEKFTISGNWIFSTGKPISLPISQFTLSSLGFGIEHYGYVIEWGPYNGYRMKNYHRLDLAFKFTRVKTKYQRTWELGVYNTYNRLNPYKYFLNYRFTNTVLKEISYFPILPYATFTIKF